MRNYWRCVAFVRCLFLHVTDGISCKLVGLLLHISMNNPSGGCIVMFKDLPGTQLPQLVLVYKLQSTRSVVRGTRKKACANGPDLDPPDP